MSQGENGMSREALKQELLRRAREDHGFRALVLDHPQEACGHMGFRIPGAAGEALPYLSAVEQMYRRHEFYQWYYQHVLGQLRAPEDVAAPQNLDNFTDMEWDFEVTKYTPSVRDITK